MTATAPARYPLAVSHRGDTIAQTEEVTSADLEKLRKQSHWCYASANRRALLEHSPEGGVWTDVIASNSRVLRLRSPSTIGANRAASTAQEIHYAIDLQNCDLEVKITSLDGVTTYWVTHRHGGIARA